MNIKADQIERLASYLLDQLRSRELLTLRADAARVKSEIERIIAENFAEEEQIEAEAKRTLAEHVRDAPDIDPHRMFLLLKQRIARQRGFVL